MKNVLHIGNLETHVKNKEVYLTSTITFPNHEKKVFFFKYPLFCKQYLNFEVVDGFLLSFLPYCLRNDINIKSDTPASDYLLWNLKEILIPTLSQNISTHSSILLDIPSSNITFSGFASGTGLSCGVDSFYTILKNLNIHVDKTLDIKYLCFFNAGAAGNDNKAYEKYITRLKHFKKVAEELNCKLIYGETNINEIYPDSMHEKTHVYRTLGMVMNLQKLFKYYYFSSGMVFIDFKFVDFDPAFYDILSMQALSTNSTRLILCGGEVDRIGKLRFISNNHIVRKNLNVCIPKPFNCGHCLKCVRTMLELFLIGEIDNFSESFDVDYFHKHFHHYVREALIQRKSLDMDVVVRELKKRHLIKMSDYFYACLQKNKSINWILKLIYKNKKNKK